MQKSILMILSRDPYKEASGRSQVIKTNIEILSSLGYKLSFYLLGVTAISDTLKSKGQASRSPETNIPINLLKSAHRIIFKGESINEHMLLPTKTKRHFTLFFRNKHFDYVWYDGIRTAMLRLLSKETFSGPPIQILDLDDLLSDRYSAISTQETNSSFFGFLEKKIPNFLVKKAKLYLPYILKFESRRLAAREVHWAVTFDVCSLVSPTECKKLSVRSATPIHCLPMAITPYRCNKSYKYKENTDISVVFLGSPLYRQNYESLEFISDSIIPKITQAISFKVIGKFQNSHKARFTNISFLGYASDLEFELTKHHVAIAPVFSGSGIKTKILDTLNVSLPLVCSSKAIEGTSLRPGQDVIVLDSADQYSSFFNSLQRDDLISLRASGISGQKNIHDNFSVDVIKSRWETILGNAQLKQNHSDLNSIKNQQPNRG